MPEESTTPDLVEVAREVFEAASRRDVDAMMSRYAPDAVWEAHPLGEAFEGAAAIRGFLEGWFSSYEAYQTMPEEIIDLGSGVVLAVIIHEGRLAGSNSELRVRDAHIYEWREGMIVRTTVYADIDEGRAAAGRLAEERGRDV